MDVEDFRRVLREGMDPSELFNEIEDGEPLDVDGASAELTDANPSEALFAEAAAEVENQRPLLGPAGQWNFCHGDNAVEGANTELTEPLPSAAVSEGLDLSLDFDIDKNTADVEKFMEDLDRQLQSPNNIEVYLSDPYQGVEHTADDGNQADNDLEEAMATHEYGSNNLADSRVHGCNHRAGNAETVASSQLVGAHSYNHGKDELEESRNQKRSSINHKSSQAASCAALPEATSNEDEMQSTSVANTDGEELVTDPEEPRVGLEFCSEEEVYNFYSSYAERNGFNVRRGKAEYLKSNRAIITGKYFLCARQGHKSKEQIDKPTRYKKKETRAGCGAKIKCAIRDGIWKISHAVLEHSHLVEGYLPVAHGREEDSSATMTLSTDKIVNEVRMVREQAHVSDVDCSNVSRDTRKNHPMPEPKDTQDLLDYFKIRQIEDPPFFYALQGKAASSIGNFFWRDSRSKIDYEHFGDVLVLDTRTGINKYDMICAVFWGLNHHRQRIIFGCAFLVDQTVDSLNWLLKSFHEAMSCHEPQTIITELGEEFADALRGVFQKTSHCLPFWSILNGFSKNLPALSDRSSIGNLFRECIFRVHSPQEFELKWNSFVGKCELDENRWLASLYEMREKWSNAFTKNVFSAGLLSIQNNEDARAIFGDLSCDTMTLAQIAQWLDKMAEDMRCTEFLEDMSCEKTSANLQPKSPMEKEAERLYTRPIFNMFREELSNILSLAIKEIGGEATFHEFMLTEHGSGKKDYVRFDPSDSTSVCSCRKFDSVGLLCSHALKVLNFMNIFNIPSRHLRKRWTKSAKDSLPEDTPRAGTALDEGLDNLFMVKFMRWALHVAHKCVNKKRKRKAMAFMKYVSENIAKVPKIEEVTVALHNSDGNDGMDQTIRDCALRSQLEQDNVAKSGMR